MSDLIWPPFYADEIDWQIAGGIITGGAGLGGVSQTADISGGGYWSLSMSGLLASREDIMAARAVRSALKNGATYIEVGTDECWFRPREPGPTVPFSDGETFSDGSEFAASPTTAAVGPYFAEGATSGAISIDNTLVGGEFFSVDHPNLGRRMYHVTKIISQGGGVASIEWLPPTRELVPALTDLDFNNPSCLMKLAAPFDIPSEHGITAPFSVEFVEWFGESVAPAPPPVSELAAEDTGSGEATVSWRNPWSTKLDHVRVWRGAAADAFADAVDISGAVAATRGALDSYVDTGLGAATYRYWVVAYSSGSDASDEELVEVAVT